MHKDLKIIKKLYGEGMMHLCRKLFPTFLEEEGLLSGLMLDNFEPSRVLYKDLVDNNKISAFHDYLLTILNKKENEYTNSPESPWKLLKKVGYTLYECKTEEDIQKFKIYYAPNEKLCTFNGNRLATCYVFFAVKENADKIKRENFKKPQRQDEYGTSVISIQFTRGKTMNTLSIKNRYNHTVVNPDATFGNNLENIVPGLTTSFEREYGLNIYQNNDPDFELDNYVLANDGKYYRYNHEINGIYYCPNNVIIDKFEVKRFSKEKFVVLDYFILDLVNKELYLYDSNLEDSFVDAFESSSVDDFDHIKTIQVNVLKNEERKVITIVTESNKTIIIELDSFSRITKYINNTICDIDDYFLASNYTLEYIELANVLNIGDEFLMGNESLTKLILPKVKTIGKNCLENNSILEEIYMPYLQRVGSHFLSSNENLEILDLPNLEKAAFCFISENEQIHTINLPRLREAGDYFLSDNEDGIISLNLPELVEVGDDFCAYSKNIREFYAPKLVEVGDNFMKCAINLNKIEIPNIKLIGSRFLFRNEELSSINFPVLEEIKANFLSYNNKITEINLPNVVRIGANFMEDNKILNTVIMPNLRIVGNAFLSKARSVTTVQIPSDTHYEFYLIEEGLQKDLYSKSLVVSIKKVSKRINYIIKNKLKKLKLDKQTSNDKQMKL